MPGCRINLLMQRWFNDTLTTANQLSECIQLAVALFAQFRFHAVCGGRWQLQRWRLLWVSGSSMPEIKQFQMRSELQPPIQMIRFPSEWWGPVGANQIQLTLQEIIENGSITNDMCSLLSQVVANGSSLLVASSRSGAGKTTLLTALVEQIDPSRRKVFVRGSYETFDFLQG